MKSPQTGRRWHQLSLRSLFVLTTLAALLLARVVYLRQLAAHHKREEERYIAQWRLEYESPNEGKLREQYFHHRSLAKEYERVAWRPWGLVRDVPK